MRHPRFKGRLPLVSIQTSFARHRYKADCCLSTWKPRAEAQSGLPKPSLRRLRYGPFTPSTLEKLNDPDATGRQE